LSGTTVNGRSPQIVPGESPSPDSDKVIPGNISRSSQRDSLGIPLT
jgi:hypothetical protein